MNLLILHSSPLIVHVQSIDFGNTPNNLQQLHDLSDQHGWTLVVHMQCIVFGQTENDIHKLQILLICHVSTFDLQKLHNLTDLE